MKKSILSVVGVCLSLGLLILLVVRAVGGPKLKTATTHRLTKGCLLELMVNWIVISRFLGTQLVSLSGPPDRHKHFH